MKAIKRLCDIVLNSSWHTTNCGGRMQKDIINWSYQRTDIYFSCHQHIMTSDIMVSMPLMLYCRKDIGGLIWLKISIGLYQPVTSVKLEKCSKYSFR